MDANTGMVSRAGKPRLERRFAEETALYGIEQLRAAYHDLADNPGELVRLRNRNVTRSELAEEIWSRVTKDDHACTNAAYADGGRCIIGNDGSALEVRCMDAQGWCCAVRRDGKRESLRTGCAIARVGASG